MSVKILRGDCRDVLRTLDADSVDCIVTSPPYWGLRDYGTAIWIGGDEACEHVTVNAQRTPWANSVPGPNGRAKNLKETHWKPKEVGGLCGKCGALKVDHQIGLESTMAAYLETIVLVSRELRRVLKPDGTFWLNIGDSFFGGGYANHKINGEKWLNEHGGDRRTSRQRDRINSNPSLKPKDLCMIPNRVAIMLQEDGWYVRSEIVWQKPNPLPESVTDRPSVCHEKVWLLTKSGRYFYDAAAIRNPPSESFLREIADGYSGQDTKAFGDAGVQSASSTKSRVIENARAKIDKQRGHGRRHAGFNDRWDKLTKEEQQACGSNARNVWTIATRPFSDAHFACVDAETECLTAQGWKKHDEIRAGEIAAQFDLATQKLSWAPIVRVATYEVKNQEMVVGKCRDLDIWLTPNHRTIIQRRNSYTNALRTPIIIRADQLKATHSIPTAAHWNFEGDASLPLEWAELLGWYVAEGHESGASPAIEIYQSESANPHKCRRIEELLRQVGAEWTKATCERVWKVGVVRKDPGLTRLTAYRVTGYAAVRLREMAPRKKLPWASAMWSTGRIRAVLEGMIEGDGHTRLDGRRSFVQKDIDQCGLFQALAMRLGFSATVSVRPDNGIGVVYVTAHTTRSFRGTNGVGSPPEIRTYTGVVWCPQLPHSTWVARRNGRAFITGNTMPPELAERCIKAGSPPGGLILDPFGGAGTTALVADRLGRNAISIELSEDFAAMSERRIAKDAGMFADINSND